MVPRTVAFALEAMGAKRLPPIPFGKPPIRILRFDLPTKVPRRLFLSPYCVKVYDPAKPDYIIASFDGFDRAGEKRSLEDLILEKVSTWMRQAR